MAILSAFFAFDKAEKKMKDNRLRMVHLQSKLIYEESARRNFVESRINDIHENIFGNYFDTFLLQTTSIGAGQVPENDYSSDHPSLTRDSRGIS